MAPDFSPQASEGGIDGLESADVLQDAGRGRGRADAEDRDHIGRGGPDGEARYGEGRPDGPVLRVGDDIAVAGPRAGVRGYQLRGVHYFLGVPYGADTSGANRFMPPQKPKPWTDIRPTLWWGNTAPQNMDNRYASPYGSFRDHWNYDDVSEDCLRLNVFTPALKDGKKRPVMFWIHGGGFPPARAPRPGTTAPTSEAGRVVVTVTTA